MQRFFIMLMLPITLFAGAYHNDIHYIFPLPDSDLLPIETTIILRLEEQAREKIDQISGLISVSSTQGAHRGYTFWSSDNKTIIFKPNTPFQLDTKIRVRINLDTIGSEKLDYYFQTAPNSSPDAVAERKSLSITKPTAAAPHDYAPIRVQNGVALPSDFPKITTRIIGETEPGKIFFATNYPASQTGNYLIICENDGTPYFYRKYPNIIRSGNFTLQPNGLLTAFFYFEWYYTVLDSHFNEIEQIRAGHGYETDNHELILQENNHALLIARDRLNMDLRPFVSGGKSDAVVQANHIQELDADRNVIFEWRSWDHYNIQDSYINLRDSFLDYVHINSIAVDCDNNLVISSRDLNEFTKINRETGEIIWRMGGHHNEFNFLNGEIAPAFAHDFRPIPGHPHHYTVFDNGRGKNPQVSRGVEYFIDPEKMTIERVWQYRHSPDWFSGYMGSVQRFDSGNTFLDFPGSSLRAVEIDAANNKVFEIYSHGHSNYRCRRYKWNGSMTRPDLQVENMSAVIRLFINQFGDSSIKKYNIYYGTDKDHLKLLDSTENNWYDVDATELKNHTTYYFKASSFDQQNNESIFSNQQSVTTHYIAAGQNAIQNGTFMNLTFWEFATHSPAVANGERVNGEYKIDIHKSGDSLTNIQLKQDNLLLIQGKTYTFAFDAQATQTTPVDAKIISTDGREINYGEIGITRVGTEKQRYEYHFTMNAQTDAAAQVVFNCGLASQSITLDNVSLIFEDETPPDKVIKINFQPEDAQTPDGYFSDKGEKYADRGNGHAYGWLYSDNANSRIRNTHADPRFDTLNHLQKEKDFTWEIALPNASYQVYIVAGDAQFTDQLNHLDVENTKLYDADGMDPFDYFEETIHVADGRLTIAPAIDADNAKICFIEISPLETQVANKSIPAKFELLQNYPNPFNPMTRINFHLSEQRHVEISIFNALGKKVDILADGLFNAGNHTIIWNAEKFASGVYYYQLRSGSYSKVKKMLFLR